MIGDEDLHPVTNIVGLLSFRNLFLKMLSPAIVAKRRNFFSETHPAVARGGRPQGVRSGEDRGGDPFSLRRPGCIGRCLGP
jgi:hypothetical protein